VSNFSHAGSWPLLRVFCIERRVPNEHETNSKSPDNLTILTAYHPIIERPETWALGYITGLRQQQTCFTMMIFRAAISAALAASYVAAVELSGVFTSITSKQACYMFGLSFCLTFRGYSILKLPRLEIFLPWLCHMFTQSSIPPARGTSQRRLILQSMVFRLQLLTLTAMVHLVWQLKYSTKSLLTVPVLCCWGILEFSQRASAVLSSSFCSPVDKPLVDPKQEHFTNVIRTFVNESFEYRKMLLSFCEVGS
jgi:hypothetical protein